MHNNSNGFIILNSFMTAINTQSNLLQIIHKGKVIYPDSKLSMHDSSEQILNISSSDLIHQRKKPSLVVMGLRQSNHVQNSNSNVFSFHDLLFAVSGRLSPRYLWNTTTWGLKWTMHATFSLLSGLCLFIQSILFPPQVNQRQS